MMRNIRYALQTIAVAGLVMLVGPALAAQSAGVTPTIQTAKPDRAPTAAPARVHLVAQAGEQTARLPVGTIRLRVIPRIGGNTVRENINWKVMTYGRDASGNRRPVTEVRGPTPELTLPAGWYVVHARVGGQLLKHPVEVTAGRVFKYTLVKR